MVSIAAFQAVDPVSIPGHRSLLTFDLALLSRFRVSSARNTEVIFVLSSYRSAAFVVGFPDMLVVPWHGWFVFNQECTSPLLFWAVRCFFIIKLFNKAGPI